ncbi:hypothetical protein HDU76_010613, partial [Blyttiomyces sp. JEL0837]
MTYDHQPEPPAKQKPAEEIHTDAVSDQLSKEESNAIDLDGPEIFNFVGDWDSTHTIGHLLDLQLPTTRTMLQVTIVEKKSLSEEEAQTIDQIPSQLPSPDQTQHLARLERQLSDDQREFQQLRDILTRAGKHEILKRVRSSQLSLARGWMLNKNLTILNPGRWINDDVIEEVVGNHYSNINLEVYVLYARFETNDFKKTYWKRNPLQPGTKKIISAININNSHWITAVFDISNPLQPQLYIGDSLRSP